MDSIAKGEKLPEERKIRVLLTMHPYDGHERGYYVVTAGLRDAGIEVILGGKGQIATEIAQAALQEDVDFIGYRIMLGAPMVLLPRLFAALREAGAEHIPVIVGGIVRDEEVPKLKEMGVAEVFRPGVSIDSIVDFMRSYCH